jgi:hypothetical protein
MWPRFREPPFNHIRHSIVLGYVSMIADVLRRDA